MRRWKEASISATPACRAARGFLRLILGLPTGWLSLLSTTPSHVSTLSLILFTLTTSRVIDGAIDEDDHSFTWYDRRMLDMISGESGLKIMTQLLHT